MNNYVKTCVECNQSKSTENWPKQKSSKDGLKVRCRECHDIKRRAYDKKRRDSNIEAFREKESSYRQKNSDKICKNRKQWREENAASLKNYNKNYSKKYRKKKKLELSEYHKTWCHENKEKISIILKRYSEKKRNLNPAFIIYCRIGAAIRSIFKSKSKKYSRSLFYTGCQTTEEFFNIMSSKTNNPNWITDKYQLDHIMQINWFDSFIKKEKDKIEEITLILNHHSNLRPLPAEINGKRSLLDVSFVTPDLFSAFSQLWNLEVVNAYLAYSNNRDLFTGEIILRGSSEENLLKSLLI